MSVGITLEPFKRKSRSENWVEEDKNLLFDLVCERIEIIENKSNTTEMNYNKKVKWEEIGRIFNSKCKCDARTILQIKLQWKRMKINIKKESPTLYNELKNGFKESSEPPSYKDATQKSKRPKHSNLFNKVRQYCVALLMTHGRPSDLLDDTAFQNLLSLIPITDQERAKLTSVPIRDYIDNEDNWSADSSDADDEDGFEDNCGDADKTDEEMEKTNAPFVCNVKVEPIECSGPASGSAGSHDTGCLAITQDTYRQYFEISTDEATCKLCSKVISWTSSSDLKVHMDIYHPSIAITDHKSKYTADRGDENSKCENSKSSETIEQIFLEEAPSTAKKRKCPSNTFVTLVDSKTVCIERFKSLDRFGLYVASLLKLLPVEKTRKYQEQIVQTLLMEQAAAG